MKQLIWEPTAVEDLTYWKQTDLKKYQKILELCESICLEPTIGIGKPEPLKHELSGCWSRRIDKKHRLVYRFDGHTVYILQARHHYGG
jgi:toxin YoeB